MKPLIWAFIVTAALGAVVLAQTTVSQPPAVPKYVEWRSGQPGSDEILQDGAWVRSLTVDGVTVRAKLDVWGRYEVAYVVVSNNSYERILVVPQDAYLVQPEPHKNIFKAVNPDRIERSIGRRAAWRTALVGFAGGMGSTQTVQQQGTFEGDVSGHDSSGNFNRSSVSGTYQGRAAVPDPEAQRRTEEAVQSIQKKARDEQGELRRSALRANTVLLRANRLRDPYSSRAGRRPTTCS